MNIEFLVLVGIGVFTILCAALNFDWFMNHRKARFFVNIMGRDGARIFYMIVGVAIMAGAFIMFR